MAMPSHSCKAASELRKVSALGSHFPSGWASPHRERKSAGPSMTSRPALRKAPAARGMCIAEVTRRIRGSRAEYIDSVYTLRYNSKVANGIEFDWDAENTKHLAAHKVTAREFESVMHNSPLDLAYEVVDGEER